MRQRNHDAPEVVIHKLDCSGNVDVPRVQIEFDRQCRRVAEHDGVIDVSPAELGGDWWRSGSGVLEFEQLVHEGIEGPLRSSH